MSKGKLYGISVGPGDPELITMKAIKALKLCPIIAAPQTKGDKTFALEIASKGTDLSQKEILYLNFPMINDKIELDKNYSRQAEIVCRELEKSNVAMLSIGDISLYSTFSYVAERVAKKGFEVISIPGVPSFCACASSLNLPLVIRDQSLHVYPYSEKIIDEAISQKGTRVIMKSGKNVSRVLNSVCDAGLSKSTSIVTNCGLKTEIARAEIKDPNEDFGYFSTIIIKDNGNSNE